jgi:hypothetical protein
MTRLQKIVAAVVAVLVVAVGGFFVFEYFDRHEKVKDSTRACDDLLKAPPGAAVPSGLDFAVPAGQTLLDVTTQGKTSAVTVYVEGGRKDLVRLRDQAVSDMRAQGYTASPTDQEPTYEAEGRFGGKVNGTIKVQPLCSGYDSIRYKFNR